MKPPKKNKSKTHRNNTRDTEQEEISLLNTWIDSNKPNPGTNPLSAAPPSQGSLIGRLGDGTFSLYVGCRRFNELPVSENTKRGLKEGKFVSMTEVQAATLPHALCGRDVLGAAKTGSGKTLAFVVPVLEKLYRARWGPEDGVGCIILSPTRELAGQIFDVLKIVGKHHSFSAGLLIGGGSNFDTEREHVSELNILVCTPGRLLQHMDETPNFECSKLQILILDEADRILDVGFKKALNAIILQLPRHRQTLLFSATQTKSVQDLARLSLKDPEYISVHEESITATPSRLHQTAIIVPLDQKLDMLWSFIKAHLNSRILVFLSSCKQVKFVFEAFKKLRPGIPLKCLHGRMKQHTRMGIYNMFSEEKRSVLFCTDVASRGLDFNKAVDWVVQVDCPEDVAAYIHRVGRTARYRSMGQSVLFLVPSEMKMLEKLQDKKVPVQFKKTNMQKLQPISKLLASLLAQNKGMPDLAKRAFITYLKSIYLQKDKEVFDVMKLPFEEYSLSLGLPMAPKIRFLNRKTGSGEVFDVQVKKSDEENMSEHPRERPVSRKDNDDKEDESFFVSKKIPDEEKQKANVVEIMPEIQSKSKKKLKINVHRPVGTRVVFDDEGDTLAPLATMAETQNAYDTVDLDKNKVFRRYAEEREALKQEDEEDKRLDRKRRKELRKKQKMKMKRGRQQEDDDDVAHEDELSDSEGEGTRGRLSKKPKVYFDDGSDGDECKRRKGQADNYGDSSSLAEQEALALKLLGSLHS